MLHRHALAVLDLHDGVVVGDEERAFGDVTIEGREKHALGLSDITSYFNIPSASATLVA